MKNYITPFIISTMALTTSVQAGETTSIGSTPSEIQPLAPSLEHSDTPEYFKFSLDSRLRYESRIQQGFDHSDALTLRIRPGLRILPNKILSAFIESEHTTVIADDFRASNPALNPFRANNTQIIDAENNEINQAYLQLQHKGLQARVGRQRIKLDNLHLVGNAGWRQNEQTFEAASLSYKKNDLFLYYAYANQLNRVFGSEATGNQKKLEGDMNLINLSTKIGEAKVGGYAYLLEFDTIASFANSNTYGVQIDYDGLHAEYAYQTESGSKASYNADYLHVHYTKELGNINYKAGVEYLEDGFVTPLAALHGPNGYADAFVSARRGIPGNDWDGLTDIYGVAETKVAGVNVQLALHYFMDDSLSDSYGWETDLTISREISKNLTLVGKSAYFVGDDSRGNIFADDIIQNSVQLDYKF